MTNDNFVSAGYSQVCGSALSTATITSGNISIGGNTTYYPANQWIPAIPYYPTYWPTYYPNNEAALRETLREKEAVIEEMRELVKMQRQLLKALLPNRK